MSEEKTCKVCGEPAEYVEREKDGRPVCAVCVHYDAGADMGERFGAATMFMVSAQVAHSPVCGRPTSHALVTESLKDDECPSVDVPWLGSIEEPRAERPWLKKVKPWHEHVEGQEEVV